MSYFVGCWPQTSGAPHFSIEFIGGETEAEEKMRAWVSEDNKEGINIPYFINSVSEMAEGNPNPKVGDSFYPKSGWDNFPNNAPCWFRGRKRLC